MALSCSVLALLGLLVAPPDTARARVAPIAPSDTAQRVPRVVRRFPPIEVTAPLHDMRSSETVHLLSRAALRMLPVDGLAEAIALQAGVVAQAGELHVRGGRNGETTTYLDGLCLNDPRRGTAMGVPLLALRGADLVSGAPEAQYGSGLAGTLDLHTVDPTEQVTGEARWQTDAGETAAFDRASAMVNLPLRVLGLGVVAAGDATLDETWLPSPRSADAQKLMGLSFDWRAENRMLGYAKLAPTDQSRRLVAQVLLDRHLSRPFDPAWSSDGWTYTISDTIAGLPDEGPVVVTGPPVYSATEVPGAVRYRAADHLAVTDERRLAALLSTSYLSATRRGTLSLGWLRTRSVTSLTGRRGDEYIYDNTVYYSEYGHLSGILTDPYHVIWGDDPLYRESGTDVLTLRGDGEITSRAGATLKAGAGTTLERVTLREVDGMEFGQRMDSLRAYDATAPGMFAYAQSRWSYQGLILNAGLRAEYFTAGEDGRDQTLPWDGHGVWSFSPRLGISYPVSVRDVFSLAYLRVQQNPPRDCLYDTRRLISARQPLGNPALEPATAISYEASVKHLFDPGWALQASVFFRNVWNQVGVRNNFYDARHRVVALYYASEDAASAAGTEWSLLHAAEGGRRLDLHYTWMQAWGYESRSEGDPYGPFRGWRVEPVADKPLSWDRRHSIQLNGACPLEHGLSVSWSVSVGSPLPWTPQQRRAYLTDLGLVNSRRLGWTEVTNLDLRWAPRFARGIALGFGVRNLFDDRCVRLVTVDGYPNPLINTVYDDYGAYRTETGAGGGAYWLGAEDGSSGRWVPVHDPRLLNPPRSMRMSVGLTW